MKNKFDLFNDVKNDLDNMEEIKLSDDEKKRISNMAIKNIKKNKKNFNKKGIIAATLMIGITGSFFLTNENVMAQVQNIGRKIESFLNRDDDSFKEYKKEILQVSEDKGIEFILHEALLDDEELYISSSVNYKNVDRSKLKNNKGYLNIIPSEVNYEVLVNGEKFDSYGFSSSYEYNEDGIVDILLVVDMKDMDLKNNYDIKLGIREMETQVKNDGNELIKGKWDLEFEIDGAKQANSIKTIDINKNIEIDYKGNKILVEVEKLVVSPISMSLKYKSDEEWLQMSNYDLGFEFLDDDNKKLDASNKGGDIQDGMSYKYMIDREIKKLTVIPVIVEYNKVFGQKKEFEDKAIEININ